MSLRGAALLRHEMLQRVGEPSGRLFIELEIERRFDQFDLDDGRRFIFQEDEVDPCV